MASLGSFVTAKTNVASPPATMPRNDTGMTAATARGAGSSSLKMQHSVRQAGAPMRPLNDASIR